MPLDLERFVDLRPKLYHLTAACNARRIQSAREIQSASTLLRAASQPKTIRSKRATAMWVEVGGASVHIRDQAPLHRGNVKLEGGWSFEDLLEQLNNRVFFWPGGLQRPIQHGLRHFKRYAGDDAVVLVFDTKQLFSANATSLPQYCKYNSGSPRCTGGRGSPRGPGTFVEASKFHHLPSQVIEVTFCDTVKLDGCAITEMPISEVI